MHLNHLHSNYRHVMIEILTSLKSKQKQKQFFLKMFFLKMKFFLKNQDFFRIENRIKHRFSNVRTRLFRIRRYVRENLKKFDDFDRNMNNFRRIERF